jgi:hypothetical protein
MKKMAKMVKILIGIELTFVPAMHGTMIPTVNLLSGSYQTGQRRYRPIASPYDTRVSMPWSEHD